MENSVYFSIPETFLKNAPKRGKDLIRDDVRDAGMVNSNLLNSGRLPPGSVYMPMLNDRKYLKGLKAELLGDSGGKFYLNGFETTASIPTILKRIEELGERIRNHKLQRQNQGFADDEKLPKELSEEMSKLLGTLDVRLAELKDVDKRLKVFEDREKAVSDHFVLAYGLQMMGRLRGGILAEIDGMTVGRTAEGILIINDERSPYNGMSIPDYRQMASKWQEERRQADKEKLLAQQKEAKKQGLHIPQSLPVTGCRKVARASLPGFPEHCVNYLNKVENE